MPRAPASNDSIATRVPSSCAAIASHVVNRLMVTVAVSPTKGSGTALATAKVSPNRPSTRRWCTATASQ
jgi:hypothetical protein